MTTNLEHAAWLDVDHTVLSRLRNGRRGPSPRVMLILRRKLGWRVDDQLLALERGTYPAELEERLCGNPALSES